MQALRRVASAAASQAEQTAAARHHDELAEAESAEVAPELTNTVISKVTGKVTSLAAVRARRAGHPAGRARAQ